MEVLAAVPLPPHAATEESATLSSNVQAIGMMLRKVLRREARVLQRSRVGRKSARVMSPMLRRGLRLGTVGMVLAETEVTVVRVAVEFCAPAVRVTVEGRSEQEAYSAGVMGVQLRTTAPVKLLTGVMVRG